MSSDSFFAATVFEQKDHALPCGLGSFLGIAELPSPLRGEGVGGLGDHGLRGGAALPVAPFVGPFGAGEGRGESESRDCIAGVTDGESARSGGRTEVGTECRRTGTPRFEDSSWA